MNNNMKKDDNYGFITSGGTTVTMTVSIGVRIINIQASTEKL